MQKNILLLFMITAVFFSCTVDLPTASDNNGPNLEKKLLPPGMTTEEFESIILSEESIVRNELKKGVSPESWEDNYGTAMNQYDDDTRNVALPFAFDFYGQTYNDVWVNSNGHLTFNGGNYTYWDESPLDNIDNYYSWRMIAVIFSDFNPYAGGEIYYNTVGTAGDRKFVATWLDVPRYYNFGSNTFQAQLFEGTNQIQLGYAGLTVNGFHYTQPMTVGVGAGNGTHLRYAYGSEIPALDATNVCFTPDGNGGYTATEGACEPLLLEVVLDIKPGSDQNSINRKSRGVTPVAILSTEDYDATEIDVESLLLGDASPAHDGHYEDVDEDGVMDLMLHFRTQDIGIDSETTELCITGLTNEGLELAGCDFVNIVGR